MNPHIRVPKKNTSHGNEVLTTRYYTANTKTMLPTRKSMPKQAVGPHEDLLAIIKRHKL